MARYEKPNDKAWSRKVNRPFLNRELLVALGWPRDVDPAHLFFLDDEAANDWVDVAGTTQSASSTDRGGTWASQNLRRLDAQNDEAYVSVAGLPVGAYRLRLHLKASASVADDLGVRVENFTDTTTPLAQVTRTPPTTAGYVDVLFSVRAADAGDTLRVHVKKLTGTANTVDVDYVALLPVSAEQVPWGKTPDGGRIEHTWTGDNMTGHTIYDALTGGNVIETATYAYTGDRLDSVAHTRDGRTMTRALTYDANGNLTKETRTVS